MHTDSNTNHAHYHNKDVFMAGLLGILAGVASITTLALADADVRKKVGKRAKAIKSNLQGWSAEKLHMVEHKAADTANKVTEESKEDEPLKQVAMKN